MGLRFRKSIKIAPGVKVNIGKKSVGVSLGGKLGGVSFNTRSGARARVSAPGTGLSYSTKIGGKSGGSNSTGPSPSKPSNGGGCLMTCLKILGIIILLPLILVFGWIPGIIWIIFFRKKLADEPDRQKKYTIIISILSAISLFVMICAMVYSSKVPNEPVPNKIEKSVDDTSQNQTQDDSKTSENVADKEKPQEDTSDSNLTNDTQSDATGSDLQEESNENETSTVVAPAPLPQTVQQVEQPQEQPAVAPESQSNEVVWIDDTAAKYHLKQDCSGMDNAYQVSISDAQALGKTPCGKCFR